MTMASMPARSSLRRAAFARRLFVAGVELLELEVAEGGGGLGHAVVPAELFGDVALALALGAEHAGALGDGVVAGGEHAAFAGGEVLGG